jgi:hypothetical protein
MKLYRVQVKYKDIYIDETLEAENDKAALDELVKKVETGAVEEKDAGGWLRHDHIYITYEEVNRNGTTNIDSGKIKSRTSVGQVSSRIER